MFPAEKQPEKEPRSPWPWIIAGVVVVGVVAAIVVMSRQAPPANPGGPGMAAAAPYAAKLPISDIQMSQAGNRLGGQTTYLDGRITNSGDKTVTGVTVQVGFPGYTTKLAGKSTLAMMLIRTTEPYVDTEPVGADPILPGQTREFRLIFDRVPQDWNQNYPEVRIIQVTSK